MNTLGSTLSRPGSGRACRRPTAARRAPADLHRQHRQRDRDAEPAVEHLVRGRVAGVVVVVGVARGSRPLDEQVRARAPSSVGVRHLAGQVVEPGRGTASTSTAGIGVGGDAAARPRRAARASAGAGERRRRTARAADLPMGHTVACGTVARHVRRHVPGRSRRRPRPTSPPTSWRPPARSSPTPSSTPRPTGSRSCSAPPGLRPGDHVAFCLENHPRYFEVAWGAHYAGLSTRPARPGSPSGELAYIINDCGAQGLHHVDVQGRPGRRDRRPTRPTCELRLMLDGTIDGYEQLRGRRRRAAGRRRCPTGVEGADMLYSLGHDRPAQGREGRRCPSAPLGDAPTAVAGARAAAVRLRPTTTVYLSPAPLYHAAPLRFSMAVHRARRHRRRHGALRPRAVPRPRRALPRHRHAGVPTMFVRMLKLPEEVRAALRRVVAAGRSSTPPRRARSTVKSR